MKKTLFLLLFTCLFLGTFSQKWSTFGGCISYQGNLLLNANIKQDEDISSKFGFNPHLGLSYGVNMNEFFQVSLEIGYAKMNSKLVFLTKDTAFDFKGTRKIMFNTLDFGLLFKAFSSGGYYLEFGPKYNLVNSALDIESNSLTRVDASKNVTGYFSFLLGGGILAYKKYRTNILIGFRGTLGITDFINNYGKNINYPTYKKYKNEETHRYISGMITVSLNYDIGILNSSRQTYRYPYFK